MRPASRAVRAAASTTAIGISSCSSSTSAASMASRASVTSSGVSVPLAPATTMIVFSPAPSTVISATPEA